jgi:hypothetical protein
MAGAGNRIRRTRMPIRRPEIFFIFSPGAMVLVCNVSGKYDGQESLPGIFIT